MSRLDRAHACRRDPPKPRLRPVFGRDRAFMRNTVTSLRKPDASERLQLRRFYSGRFQPDARPSTTSDKRLSILALLIAGLATPEVAGSSPVAPAPTAAASRQVSSPTYPPRRAGKSSGVSSRRGRLSIALRARPVSGIRTSASKALMSRTHVRASQARATRSRSASVRPRTCILDA
jgi:hypothetical protein